MNRWISFEKLRMELNFEELLGSYGISLTKKQNTGQHVGPCPLPNHGEKKGNTFSANFEKRLWQCFGCNQSGNIIDFEVVMGGGSKSNGKDVRAAAESLQERFLGSELPKGPSPKRPEEDAQEPARPTRPKAPTSRKNQEPSPKPSPETNSIVINPPLDFALKTLEKQHPCFAKRKLTPETVERFGLGFCKRGTLSGRIAIPLEDDQTQLIGYAGLVLDEAQVTLENPKFAFPGIREVEGVSHVFDRSQFLYNGFRVSPAVKDLIVVLEIHIVWSLWQAGFANVVSPMGYECSGEQVAMTNLLTVDTGRIWLLTDESEESSECAKGFLYQMALTRSCRWVRVEDQNMIAPDHPLLASLPKR